MTKIKHKIKWLSKPEIHNYPAAYSYLNLFFDDTEVEVIIKKLKENDNITFFKAKDIFRASGLSLLGVSNSHVKKNIKKIKKNIKLSPIILVRYKKQQLIIADGYHRVCAVYTFNEDALIPCKIISI